MCTVTHLYWGWENCFGTDMKAVCRSSEGGNTLPLWNPSCTLRFDGLLYVDACCLRISTCVRKIKNLTGFCWTLWQFFVHSREKIKSYFQPLKFVGPRPYFLFILCKCIQYNIRLIGSQITLKNPVHFPGKNTSKIWKKGFQESPKKSQKISISFEGVNLPSL